MSIKGKIDREFRQGSFILMPWTCGPPPRATETMSLKFINSIFGMSVHRRWTGHDCDGISIMKRQKVKGTLPTRLFQWILGLISFPTLPPFKSLISR